MRFHLEFDNGYTEMNAISWPEITQKALDIASKTQSTLVLIKVIK